MPRQSRRILALPAAVPAQWGDALKKAQRHLEKALAIQCKQLGRLHISTLCSQLVKSLVRSSHGRIPPPLPAHFPFRISPAFGLERNPRAP